MAHIGAGISYVTTGDFRLNPEHPPLVKILAGLALLPLHPSVPTGSAAWREYNQWDFGRQFLFNNRVNPETLLRVARIPPMLIATLLVWWVTALALRWFGPFGAVLTGTVAAFDTTLLAHGHLVTTDIPFAISYLATIYTFVRFLEHRTRRTLLLAVASFAAAVLTKFSFTTLVVTLPLVAVLHRAHLRLRGAPTPTRMKVGWKTFGWFFFCTLFLVLAVYGFHAVRTKDDPRIAEVYRRQEFLLKSGQIANERPLTRALAYWTVPGAPLRRFFDRAETFAIPGYWFWRGLTSVSSHNYAGHGAYLLGMSSSVGWWYYFPIAFAVKTPSGTLLLFALVAVIAARGSLRAFRNRTMRRNLPRLPFIVLAFAAAPLVYFTLSLTSHINLGVRHLAPVYPFVWLGVGALALFKPIARRTLVLWRGTILLIAPTVVVTTLLTAPHFLSAFNTFVGGNRNGWRYLSDSNLDWGQDLGNLARELNRRGITQPYVDVSTGAPVGSYLPNTRPIPTDPIVATAPPPPGWYAASIGVLLDATHQLSWLRARTPEFTVGDSILVYRINAD